jgi:hypothetical protein
LPSEFNEQLRGSFGGNGQWFRIELGLCDNTTASGKCWPADKIYDSLPVFNLHYVMQDTVLDGYNFNDPGILKKIILVLKFKLLYR